MIRMFSRNKKILSILLLLTLVIVSISSVSASYDLNQNEDIDIMSDNNSISGNFTNLQKAIDNSSGNEVNLDGNIVLDNSESNIFKNGILINIDGLVINGNGFSIAGTSANGSNVRIFNIQANNIVIKNITLIGGYNTDYGDVILNMGNNTLLIDVIFKVLGNNIATNVDGVYYTNYKVGSSNINNIFVNGKGVSGYLNVAGDPIVISSNDITMYYKNGTKYTVLVTENGNGVGNQIVYFIINGVTYASITDEFGYASLNLNLNPENYTIEAIYNSTGNNYNLTSNAEILHTIDGNNITKIYNDSTVFATKFLDGQGNPIKNRDVNFNINDVFYTRMTDGEGIARLNIRLSANTYISTAYHPDTNLMMSYIVTVLPTIVGQDITKYYKNGTQYKVTVIGQDGNPLKNTSITFNINGVFYTRMTDENGIATLNIDLNPGNYTITAIHPDGSMTSNNIEVLPTIFAEDIEMTVTNRVPYIVKVVDGTGKPISQQMVMININGVFYMKFTDSNGIAAININLSPGTYIATASASGNNELISNVIIVKE